MEPTSTICPIEDELDVFGARRAGRQVAVQAGFVRREQEELAIVISELATNILKYGIRGDITIELVSDDQRGLGVRVTARDIGPPIFNLETALVDGQGDRGPIDPCQLLRRRGLGAGLGAVVRLSDSFEYEPGTRDKRIRIVRYRRGVGR
jgi:anti-sigma regulatory factor (Ser/Thr protein kinase)